MCVEEHADMPRLLKSRCETVLPASRASFDGTGIRPDSAGWAFWARRLSSRGRVQIGRLIGSGYTFQELASRCTTTVFSDCHA